MALTAGTRLGVYEITALIGAGGMGEVYRARDERLERAVAIKVLPLASSGDAESRERFRREALALSRLSHPNICAIHDIGSEDGLDYLVMELLDGETLAERLARGPLGLRAALDIALQIASALDKTHRMGLAHRDLKPGNIMLTRTGAKLLDFGLARLALAGLESSSQTVSEPLTAHGEVLGTLQYMSPEALEGRPADARSDIFSFGAVLYEMVTGRRAFGGNSPASVIGAILKDDAPSILGVDSSVSVSLDRIIRNCLSKDPDDRWQSAHDVRLDLQWAAETLERPSERPPSRVSRAGWWVAVTVATLLLALLGFREFGRAPLERSPVRVQIHAPEGAQFISVGTHAGPPVLSADGQRLAFVASTLEGRTILWVRPLGSVQAQPLAGTEGAAYPFWSPNGEHVAFFADGRLKKVLLTGGVVTDLCEALYGAGGAWSRDETIVFSRLSGPVHRVAAAGGTPVPATSLTEENRQRSHRWPAFLPDGRQFLYAVGDQTKPGKWSIQVGSLDSDRSDVVLDADSNALYANGHLLFAQGGRLVAQPFDERSLRATGEAVPIADNVLQDASLGRAVFSVSERGALVYQTGAAATGSRLLWLDRQGKEVARLGEPGFYTWPRLSADGQRVAVTVADPTTGKTDIWIYGVRDRRRRQLTLDATQNGNAAWASDGNRVFFTSVRKGFRNIYSIDSHGSETEQALVESDTDKFLNSASVDGRWLIFSAQSRLWLLPLTGDRKPHRLLSSEHTENFGQISRDGRWLAYQSNESGKMEVYVTAFPPLAWKRRVSLDGGIQPRWSVEGRELFYLSQDHSTLFAAAVRAEGATFRVSDVQPLFTRQMVAGRGYTYDVTADGRRFLVVASSGAATSPLTLVLNWDADLQR